jgi:hypothetical protein
LEEREWNSALQTLVSKEGKNQGGLQLLHWEIGAIELRAAAGTLPGRADGAMSHTVGKAKH